MGALKTFHVTSENNVAAAEWETGASMVAGSDQEQVSCGNEVGVANGKEWENCGEVDGKVLSD